MAHGAADAIGQTGEFLVWASLIAQSGGRLHVFLPLLDRGIDGLIHRLDDGAYVAVQVKAKTVVGHGEAPIAIYEEHLFTPDQLVIGVFLDGSHLGPYALVADAATLMRKATRIVDRGRTMLVVDMPAAPTPGHRWTEDLVATDRLADRLGAAERGLSEPTPTIAPSDQDRVTGFLGEQKVCRRLASIDGCGLFRPFPDSEMVFTPPAFFCHRQSYRRSRAPTAPTTNSTSEPTAAVKQAGSTHIDSRSRDSRMRSRNT